MSAGAGLVARTRRLDRAAGAVDLIAAAGDDGLLWWTGEGGLAGRGVAARIELVGGLDAVALVAGALACIDTDDEVRRPGTGPVALGALPFDRAAAGTVVVPRVLVGCDGDTAWVTTVEPTADGPAGRRGAGRPGLGLEAATDEVVAAATRAGHAVPPCGAPPDEFTLVPSRPHAAWKDLVTTTVERIRAGDLAKVVLARRVEITANRPFVTSDVLERLVALYPSCMVFRVDGFLGASPELLVRRRDRTVTSRPLAGTVARSGDADTDRALVDRLLASPKDRAEHAFAVDGVRRALEPLCEELVVPDRPSILELRNVSHLATPIVGRLRGVTTPSALDLVAALHPTPAVAGTPTAEAVAYLRAVEGFDRDRFAGPVGWMDGRGDGEWALGLRSAAVRGATASICAGVGVVADSDPDAELAETQLKLQALLAALVRP